MSDIIQQWIQNRLGIIFNIKSPYFPQNIKDGRILAQLLFTYDIITAEQLSMIAPCSDSQSIKENFKHIKIWLKTIGINVYDDIVHFGERGSYTLKLLYHLYLTLQDKNKLLYLTQLKANEEIQPTSTRFNVSYVYDQFPDTYTIPDDPLCNFITKNQHIIDWQKDKYSNLLAKIQTTREKYKEHIQEKFGIVYRDKIQKVKVYSKDDFPGKPDLIKDFEETLKDLTYDELVEEEKEALEKAKFEPNPKESKKIVKKIKQKNRKQARGNILKVQMQKILLSELWKTLLEKQKKNFEESVKQKMLKQSTYEKQMATKLLEVREQKNIIQKNRMLIEEQIQREKEDEFIQKLFMKDQTINEKKYMYYIEKKRALELHKRIWEKKQKLRGERLYNTCRECVNDLVDIALRTIEYQEKYGEEVPLRKKREFYDLFIKKQPLYDILENVDDILTYKPSEYLLSDLEALYIQEIERQDAIDIINFEAYINYHWPWDLKYHFTVPEEKLILIARAKNILGYCVHRVLLAKYPKPPKAPRPNLSSCKIKACIKGLTDLTILPTLQRLLNCEGVVVLEMQTAINYCLEAYKEESIVEILDDSLVEESDQALKDIKKLKDKQQEGKTNKKVPQLRRKGEKMNSKTRKEMIFGTESVNIEIQLTKGSQTPKIFPCEELILSPKAELGKVAYELLNMGQPLTNHLLVAMFLEYLKTLTDIEGWVLINFPETLEQAVLLEEALNSRPVPYISDRFCNSTSIDDIAEVDKRDCKAGLPIDQYAKNRVSQLVNDPFVPEEEKDFDTYLTAFIHIKLALDKRPLGEEYIPDDVIDSLDKFYEEQGCNYLFEYKIYDFATVKHLAKVIIGKFTLPAKTSLELFGDTVLYLEEQFNLEKEQAGKESKVTKKGEKKTKKEIKKASKTSKTTIDKSDKSKGNKKDKKEDAKNSKSTKGNTKDKKGKKSKADSDDEEPLRKVEKETQIPTPEPEPEEPIEEPLPPPKPGEFGWKYVCLSIPPPLENALATLWENMEDYYIMDLRELFFRRRLTLNVVMPYIEFVKNHMKEYIARPDNKQEHLHNFQKIYNEIDVDLRDDDEMKAELHCRIQEFKEKMFEICDNRMRESEEERKRTIKEHWLSKNMCQLANIYITALEIEMDCCADVLQFISDYYCGMITKMPCDDKVIDKIPLELIPTVLVEKENQSVIDIMAFDYNTLFNKNSSFTTNTPYHEKFLKNYKKAVSGVKDMESLARLTYEKYSNIFSPKGKGKTKENKPKASKSKLKEDNNLRKERTLPKFYEPEQDVKNRSSDLLEEWETLIDGQMQRCFNRLELLKCVAFMDFNDGLNVGRKTFHGIYDDIHTRYKNEIISIEIACEIFARATEAEIPLQSQLLLCGDNFIIRPEVQMFPDPLPPPDKPLKEKIQNNRFTIEQLNRVVDHFISFAPTGDMLIRSFKYLLQDLVICKTEDGSEPLVPTNWQKLTPKQISKIVDEFYGKVDLLNWKDFIINNLCVSFPSEHELLKTRAHFRENDPDKTEIVQLYQYYKVPFWFDNDFNKNDPHDLLRLSKIKDLLARLFKVNDDALNYTALLLAFCRDVDTIRGIAKALELSLGKLVCWDVYTGEQYIRNARAKRHEDELAEIQRIKKQKKTKEATEKVIVDIIDKVVHTCDSVVIEEISEDVPSDNLIDESLNKSSEVIEIKIENEVDEASETSQTDELNINILKENTIKSLSFLVDEELFENVPCGFESSKDPPLIYYLPWETTVTIFTATMPTFSTFRNIDNKSMREHIEELYEELKCVEFNNNVFIFQFLNNKKFKKMFKEIFRFDSRNPVEILRQIENNS